MTTANCPGNEELDFRLIFGEEEQQQPLGPTDLEPDDNTSFYILNVGQSQSMVTNHQSIGLPRHGMQSHSQVISTSPRLQSHKPGSEPPSYEAQDKYGTSPLLPSAPVEAPKAFECPSIQITSISPSCQQEMDANEENLRANGPDGDYHSDRPCPETTCICAWTTHTGTLRSALAHAAASPLGAGSLMPPPVNHSHTSMTMLTQS